MNMSTKTLRRSLYAVFAASAAGGAMLTALAVPSATAAPDPCAASEVARTVGSVATSTGNYLDSHPQTNQALTTISQQQGGPQSLGALKNYFDANPEVAKDMQQLQQPLVNLSGRCKLPITIPQLMGLMQPAQQQGTTLPREFARRAARRTTSRCSRSRRARPAGAGFGRHAGRWSGSRTDHGHYGLVLGDARRVAGEAAELQFQTFSRLVNRKARKSATFLLSF
jgi:heme-binding protein